MPFVGIMVALSTYPKSIRLSPQHRLKLVVGTGSKISRQRTDKANKATSHSQFSLSYRADRCPKSTVTINVNIVGTCACLQACVLACLLWQLVPSLIKPITAAIPRCGLLSYIESQTLFSLQHEHHWTNKYIGTDSGRAERARPP